MKKLFLFISTAVLALSLSISANAAPAEAGMEINGGSKIVIVNPNKPDVTAPKITGLKADKKKVDLSKSMEERTVKYSVKAKDDISGIKSMHISLENEKGDWLTIDCTESSYDKKSKSYINRLTHSAEYTKTGTYKFVCALLYDNVGNNETIFATSEDCPSSLKTFKITFTCPKSKLVPSVKDITFEKSVINLSREEADEYGMISDKVQMHVTNKKGTIEHIEIKMCKNKDGGICETVYMYRDGEGEDSYSGKFNVWNTSDYYEGKYRVYEMVFFDENGASVVIPAKKLPKCVTEKTVTVKEAPKSETDFPSISKIDFKKSNVKVNKKNKVTIVKADVYVKDKTSGVESVYIILEDKKTKFTLTGSAYFVEPVRSGKVTVEFEIPRNAASGNYKLSYVYINDKSGNGRRYVANTKGYSSSTKSKTSKLTSQMKKVLMKIQNTYKK